jgi:hypothetical protein
MLIVTTLLVLAPPLVALQQTAGAAQVQLAPARSVSTRIPGDSVRFGNGVVRSWVDVDEKGVPVAIGVTLPDAVIESVPAEGAMLSLDFPKVRGLPFRHVLFDWVPGGHPPAALYGHDHWDAHFYLITADERLQIAAGETTQRPAPAFMPEGYVPVPGLGLYAFPGMGVHWVHQDASELHHGGFSQTLIYGSVGEKTIFVEPMFTSAFLARRPDFSAPIPQPASVAESGYYATRYVIRHVADSRAFRISLEEFEWREARR